MVLTKKIENKWCPSNKKHFELLGYEFTHMRDAFLVNFEDMPHNSDKFIDIKCDYCGDIFQKQIKKYSVGGIGSVNAAFWIYADNDLCGTVE